MTSDNVARLYGFALRKGAPWIGADADLTLVDLQAERRISPDVVGSSCDWNLWDGWKVKGCPVRTLVWERTVTRDGEIAVAPGYGQFIARLVAAR